MVHIVDSVLAMWLTGSHFAFLILKTKLGSSPAKHEIMKGSIIQSELFSRVLRTGWKFSLIVAVPTTRIFLLYQMLVL